MKLNPLTWFGRISIEQRAKNEIAEHERRLYTARSNLALWEHNAQFHDAEILRLSSYIDTRNDVGRIDFEKQALRMFRRDDT